MYMYIIKIYYILYLHSLQTHNKLYKINSFFYFNLLVNHFECFIDVYNLFGYQNNDTYALSQYHFSTFYYLL